MTGKISIVVGKSQRCLSSLENYSLFNKNNNNNEIVMPIPFEKAKTVEFQMRCLDLMELPEGLASHAIPTPIYGQSPHFGLGHRDLPLELSFRLAQLWWLIFYQSIFRNAPLYETHIFRRVTRTRLMDPSRSAHSEKGLIKIQR